MNSYRKDSEKIFKQALDMLKEQAILSVAELMNDSYITDRYRTVSLQTKCIERFYMASEPSYNLEYDNAIRNIKFICYKLRSFDNRTNKSDLILLERAVNLAEKVSLDTFSELQSAVIDYGEVALDGMLAKRYATLLLNCDILGLRSGNSSILTERSIDFLLEYCNDSKVSLDRVMEIYKDLKENHVVSEDTRKRTLYKLDKIIGSRIPF